MKITIFLALTLAALYVAQAQPLNKEEAQGHPLEQEQDEGNPFVEPTNLVRLKLRAATCARERKLGVCKIAGCQCINQ